MIRVLLAEDQGMMRSALALLLDLEDDIEVVAQASTGEEALEGALRLRPDVAVLDIEMPGRNGLEVARELRADLPECALLVVTAFNRPAQVREALLIGVHGFMAKEGPVEELAAAIRRILAGERVVDPHMVTDALVAGTHPLSTRELEVLRAAADGAPVVDIAKRLHLAPSTVRNYLSSVIGKLGVHNRMEAVHLSRQRGWL
jgi:two-component system response regulator DesR